MSADSPKRNNARGVPAVVPPQAVSDRSIIDSVAGFINDVTLTSQPQGDPKEIIQWARFETAADISDSAFGEDWELEGGVAPPLLLILGYGSGVQIWAIPANGEAVEVLAWRYGSVRALRILPTPISADIDLAEEPLDLYAHKRPLVAICDSSSAGGGGPQFCSVNFVSLKDGDQVKTIKFKNPIVDILANRTSVVITFPQRIAVFDARNFEDRLTVTTCHPSPGINPNPVALGSRWMAYAERKILASKRSSGGCDCDGVSSYTATVLNAAKSLGKGLRELGEQMAAGLTGSTSLSGTATVQKSGSLDSASGLVDIRQPGVITILDIKYSIRETSPTTGAPVSSNGTDPMVAHFVAHSDVIAAMAFDYSGMLLLTADKRGHDFHVFRIQPHPSGTALAAVHHLYVLHRGDTSAKVQDISFSMDSRWVAVSTMRGTTHVFPITPYGGPAGVRTHGSLHVVNRLSRFHRSAGLSVEGRSNSPVFHSDGYSNQSCIAYSNPRIPPFPRPTVVLPLAQLRQPSVLGTPPGSAQSSYAKASHGRQRISSISDDSGKPLRVCAVFAKARSWLLDPPNLQRETPAHRMQRKAVDSLFIMAGHGALIQYDLDAKHASHVTKDKVCDDTPIELEVEAKAQWNLMRKDSSSEIQPPLASDNWLLKDRLIDGMSGIDDHIDKTDERDDRWLSQVEIITHAGPHRRLWMGPQFTFKTYNTPSGTPLSHIDTEAVEIGVNAGGNRPARSNPMNMPVATASRSAVPVLIESGSCSSFEQSPRLMDKFRHEHSESDFSLALGDTQLKEDLADAMRESPAVQYRETGLQYGHASLPITSNLRDLSKLQNLEKISVSSDESVSGGGYLSLKSVQSASDSPQPSLKSAGALFEKVVNPLGTVTTIMHTPSPSEYEDANQYMDFVDDYIIHENCDEALFRPVVAILADAQSDNKSIDSEYEKPPAHIGTELIVPVIEESQDRKLSSKKLNTQKVQRYGEERMPSAYKKCKEFVDAVDGRKSIEFGAGTTRSAFENESFNLKKKKDKDRNTNRRSVEPSEEKSTSPPKEVITISAPLNTRQSNHEKGETKNIFMGEMSTASDVEEDKKSSDVQKATGDKDPVAVIKKDIKIVASMKESSPQPKNNKREDSKNKGANERQRRENRSTPPTDIKSAQDEPTQSEPKDNETSKIKEKTVNDRKKSIKIKTEEVAKVYCTEDIEPNRTEPKREPEEKTTGPKVYDRRGEKIKSNRKEKSIERTQTVAESSKERKDDLETKSSSPNNSSTVSHNIWHNFSSTKQKISRTSEDETTETEIKVSEVEENVRVKKTKRGKKASETKESTESSKSEKNTEKNDETAAASTFEFKIDDKLPQPELKKISADVKNQFENSSVSENVQTTKETKSELNFNRKPDDIQALAKSEPIESLETSVNVSAANINKKKQKNRSSDQEETSKKHIAVQECVLPLKKLTAMKLSPKITAEKSFGLLDRRTFLPKLSLDTVTTDFPEALKISPLSPLENLESKFTKAVRLIEKTSSDPISLINFESPLQEQQVEASYERPMRPPPPLPISLPPSETEFSEQFEVLNESAKSTKYTKDNLIFALCGSLHEADTASSSLTSSTSVKDSTISVEKKANVQANQSETVQYKTFEQFNDTDEQYLSLEQQEQTSASSSEETEESTCNLDKKAQQKLVEEDEELRPLIGGANSVCSMTSSYNKKDETMTRSTLVVDITLPDNNQSDSSDQANGSDDNKPEMPEDDDSSPLSGTNTSVLVEAGDTASVSISANTKQSTAASGQAKQQITTSGGRIQSYGRKRSGKNRKR